MGTLSLLAPFVLPPLLKPFAPGRGRLSRVLLGTTATAALATTIADRFVASRAGDGHDASGDAGLRRARAVQRVAGPVALGGGAVAAATWLSSRTTAESMFAKRLLPDLGSGLGALSVAMVGWDFLYYWSHRLQHEHRYLWSIHVVHHSSEHYNLSTALRQPVAEAVGTMMPYGVLGLLGIRPDVILKARGLNLIWQFWIHTEVVRSLGVGEEFLSTPSAHRVHHGSNAPYLDRNHGGILITWDRIFGTFEREREQPVYGLTTNISTFNRWTVATHEFRAMFADVARATTWRDRLRHLVGPPGWRPVVAEPVLSVAS
jgi:sterol desaturase/sphingolipid hydroxylase (fatty acid hydroxylase superfamily)